MLWLPHIDDGDQHLKGLYMLECITNLAVLTSILLICLAPSDLGADRRPHPRDRVFRAFRGIRMVGDRPPSAPPEIDADPSAY